MTGQEKPFAGVAPPLEEAVRCPLLDRDPEAWLRCCTARFLPVAGNDATARDALQESWIIVLEKLYQYRGGPPACGWVGAFVRHEAGHAAARTNRDAPLRPDGPVAGAADLDGTLYRRQLVRVLLEAIDHLPPTYAMCGPLHLRHKAASHLTTRHPQGKPVIVRLLRPS